MMGAIRSLLTLEEVASILKVTKRTVFKMIAAGELAVVKVRRVSRVQPGELERFIGANTGTAN